MRKNAEEVEKGAEKEMKKVWRSLVRSFYIVFLLYQLLVLYREIDKVSNIREVTATVSYKESIGGDTIFTNMNWLKVMIQVSRTIAADVPDRYTNIIRGGYYAL